MNPTQNCPKMAVEKADNLFFQANLGTQAACIKEKKKKRKSSKWAQFTVILTMNQVIPFFKKRRQRLLCAYCLFHFVHRPFTPVNTAKGMDFCVHNLFFIPPHGRLCSIFRKVHT